MVGAKQDACQTDGTRLQDRLRLDRVLAEEDLGALGDHARDLGGGRDGCAGGLGDVHVGLGDHGGSDSCYRAGDGLRELAGKGDGGRGDATREQPHVEHDDAGDAGDAVGAATQRATAGVKATERDGVDHMPTL